MGAVTCPTRTSGYLFLRQRVFGPRLKSVMDNLPGYVLVSVIVPVFFSHYLADLLALLVTFADFPRRACVYARPLGMNIRDARQDCTQLFRRSGNAAVQRVGEGSNSDIVSNVRLCGVGAV